MTLEVNPKQADLLTWADANANAAAGAALAARADPFGTDRRTYAYRRFRASAGTGHGRAGDRTGGSDDAAVLDGRARGARSRIRSKLIIGDQIVDPARAAR